MSRSGAESADPGAAAGGSGAPPPAAAPNRAPEGATRVYHTPEISVLWFADRCIHSGECIRAQPRVFDASRRPWIQADAAPADGVAEAVVRCPTGALHFIRHDGGPPEAVVPVAEIRTVRNGPYYVRGPVRVVSEDGEPLRTDTRVALCRCGESRNMPFCDNTHRAIRFRDPGVDPDGRPPGEGPRRPTSA